MDRVKRFFTTPTQNYEKRPHLDPSWEYDELTAGSETDTVGAPEKPKSKERWLLSMLWSDRPKTLSPSEISSFQTDQQLITHLRRIWREKWPEFGREWSSKWSSDLVIRPCKFVRKNGAWVILMHDECCTPGIYCLCTPDRANVEEGNYAYRHDLEAETEAITHLLPKLIFGPDKPRLPGGRWILDSLPVICGSLGLKSGRFDPDEGYAWVLVLGSTDQFYGTASDDRG